MMTKKEKQELIDIAQNVVNKCDDGDLIISSFLVDDKNYYLIGAPKDDVFDQDLPIVTINKITKAIKVARIPEYGKVRKLKI